LPYSRNDEEDAYAAREWPWGGAAMEGVDCKRVVGTGMLAILRTAVESKRWRWVLNKGDKKESN